MDTEESNILKIHAQDIHTWSSKDTADKELPEIIQDLVFTSSTGLTRCDFHHSDCNNLPGWDGMVENASLHPFIPIGKSSWEISVRKDVRSKLDEDYETRTSNTEKDERLATTLVLVTGRRYAHQHKWERQKNELKDWKAVRLITAEQLAVWLNMYPSQQLLFAKRIGNVTAGMATLDDEWNQWSRTSLPELPAYFFAQDVNRYKDKFANWLESSGKQSYTIVADSISEGFAFVHCLAQTEKAKPFRNRFIIFKDPGIAMDMLNRQPDIITVTSDESILESSASQHVNAHSIFICTKNQPGITPQATVGLLDFDSVQKFSQEYKQCTGKDFSPIARRCGYNRCIIRREISTMVKRPEWVKQTDGQSILLGLAMLGSWDVDSDLLLEITDHKYTKEELIIKLNGISRMEDPPIWHLETTQWYVHSKLDVLINLAPTAFTNGLLTSFYSILKTAITENNPSHAEQGRLKQLIDTAIILAVYQSELKLHQPTVYEGTMQVLALFRQSLESCHTHANISLLPDFAELAPAQFLDWLHGAESSPDFLSNLLSDEQACDSIATSLTLIAIHEKYFSTAIMQLIAFARKAENKKSKGRYQYAIASLIDAHFPQTNAHIRERLWAFRKLSEELPVFAWEFCIRQLNIHGGSYFYNRFSKWRNDGWRIPDTIYKQDAQEMRLEALAYLFSIATWDFSQIKDMLEKCYACSVPLQEKIWKKAVFSAQFLSEADRYRLYLDNVRSLYPARLRKEAPENINFAKIHLPDIFPKSPKYKYIYYFSNTVTYLGDRELERFFQTDIKVLQRFIKQTPHAIQELLSSPRTHFPRVSRACAAIMREEELVKLTLALPSDLPGYREFVSCILMCGHEDACKNRLRHIVRAANDNEKLSFIYLAPCQPATWEVLQETLPHKQVEYWQNLPATCINVPRQALPAIAQKLLYVNRPEAVLSSWYNLERDLPPILQARLLGAYARKERIDICETGVMDGTIASLLQNLHHTEGIPLKRLVYLEFAYSNNQLFGIPTNSAIAKAFRKSPKLAAAIWKKYICPPKTAYEKNATYIIHKAYQHVIILDEENFPKDAFISWSQEVIKEFGDNNYKEALYCLGVLLASGTYHDINDWLHHDIMEIIEFFNSSDLEEGFEHTVTELSCRVTCRGADEGGLQELKLAFELEKYVQALDARHFSRAISIIKKIIDSVKYDAEFHDRSALATKISAH